MAATVDVRTFTDKIVIDACDASWGDWAGSEDGITGVEESTIKIEGTDSTKLNVDASASGNDYAIWTNTTLDVDISSIVVSTSGSAPTKGYVGIWLYFDEVDYIRADADGYAVALRIGSASGDYQEYRINKSEIIEDTWQLFLFDMTLPSYPNDTVNLDWTGIDYYRIVVYEITGNSNDFNVYLDDFFICDLYPQRQKTEIYYSEGIDQADWVGSLDGLNGVINNGFSVEGEDSLDLNVDASADVGDVATWTNTSLSIDLSAVTGEDASDSPSAGYISLSFFASTADVSYMVASGTAIIFTVGDQGTGRKLIFNMDVSDIVVDNWNRWDMDLSNPDSVSGAGNIDWTATDFFEISVNEASGNSNDFDVHFDNIYGTAAITWDSNNINLLGANTYDTDNTKYDDKANRIKIPLKRDAYSYERWTSLHFTGSFNSVSSIQFYHQDGVVQTGLDVTAGNNAILTTAINTVSADATSSLADWDTTGEAVDITPTGTWSLPFNSEFAVTQLKVSDGSTFSGPVKNQVVRYEWTES